MSKNIIDELTVFFEHIVVKIFFQIQIVEVWKSVLPHRFSIGIAVLFSGPGKSLPVKLLKGQPFARIARELDVVRLLAVRVRHSQLVVVQTLPKTIQELSYTECTL